MNAHLFELFFAHRSKPDLNLVMWKKKRFWICHVFCLSLAVLVWISNPLAATQTTGTLRIYLARHGETDWNAERRLQGSSDVPLNSKGREQAAQLAERLKGISLDAVYCSALSRSRDTANIARNGTPLKTLAGLNEQAIGKFEGKKVDGSDPVTEQEWRRRRSDPNDELDGGESLNRFYERVRTAFEEIRRKHNSGAILIVGHAVTNQMILRDVLGLTLKQALSIRQANDELYLIELDVKNPPRLWKLITEANLSDL